MAVGDVDAAKTIDDQPHRVIEHRVYCRPVAIESRHPCARDGVNYTRTSIHNADHVVPLRARACISKMEGSQRKQHDEACQATALDDKIVSLTESAIYKFPELSNANPLGR